MDNSLILEENLVKIAENAPKVYESGHRVGYEEGKKAEYDAFWDGLQHNGDGTTDYRYKFFYWEDSYYNPKYPIYSTKSSMVAAYQNARITDTLVDIDLSATQLAGSMFANASLLVTIRKLIFGKKLTDVGNMFLSCNSLVELNAEGEICVNNLNLKWSTLLNKASIESVINALSATTSGLTVTFSAKAVANAFTDEEWAALEATKTNWTISLV